MGFLAKTSIVKGYSLKLLSVALLLIGLQACSGSKDLSNVTSEATCEKKEGYWYNNRCWAGFEEHGITKQNIDSVYKAEMEEIEKAYVSINGVQKPLDFFFPEMSEEEVLLIVSFEKLEHNLILSFEPKFLDKKDFTAEASYLKGNIIEGPENVEPELVASGPLKVSLTEEFEVFAKGKMNGTAGETFDIDLHGNESVMGAGSSQLTVKGNEAFLSGTLGTMTYGQIKNMVDEHPEVETIVLTKVLGSVNDDMNLFTCSLVRESGLNTKVLADSDIASGAVDFFASGKERILTRGAKLGVHSWGGGDFNGDEISKEHPAHQYQLAYFTAMLGEEKGPDFYFYTLAAAPADDIYYMQESEVLDWNLASKLIK